MSKIISFDEGTTQVDIDLLADKLSMSTSDIKKAMQLFALQSLLNEAERLNASEQFDKQKKVFPCPPIKDSHLVAAAKSMLQPTISS
jgi:hypothetical protein